MAMRYLLELCKWKSERHGVSIQERAGISQAYLIIGVSEILICRTRG
jgi:hypothetical protein